jgi:sugar lactone lactonase YvrE
MADHAGNIYIADKRAHAIRKVRIDGTIVTVAGINVAGSGPTNPSQATSVALNNPNGLWVREDGLFYILDRDNGYIRRVDTNGLMTTIVDHGFAIPGGRGLWVSEDESRIFYAAGTQVMTWDPTNGLAPFASGFSDLGNIAMDPQGNLAVTDDRLSQVFRLQSDGTRTVIAGNGNIEGGQDGDLAINVGLAAVRGIWFLPTGAFFLCTDVGCQVWYVDTSGYIHLVLNGDSNAHAGDGAWFYEDPSLPKIGAGKQIVLDDEGNLLVTENAVGYVRKITFLHHGQ